MPRILSTAGILTTTFYMAYFMAQGVHAPFWPLWLADWGLTPAEVAFFTALGMSVRLIAGLAIPSLADRLDARRHVLGACLVAAIALFLLHPLIGDRTVLLAATLAVGAAFAAINPISEALGAAAARAHDFPYAQSRGLGSIGFVAGNLVVGAALAPLGVDVALWAIVACLVLALALTPGHPGGGRAQGYKPPRLPEIGRLFVDPVFALFVATVAFLQGSHAVFFALGSIHWAALGLTDGTVGALWAVAVLSEIVFMVLFGSWTLRRIGPVRALTLAGVFGMIRWTALMFDPVGWPLWLLQLTHAATFALAHLGAMAFILEAVPQRYGASAQGAMGSMAVGLMLAIGMALAGLLYATLGGRTYGIGAAFSFVGLALSLLLARRWRGGALAL